MKVKDIIYGDTAQKSQYCFIDNICNMPEDIPWPVDVYGNKLLHILSFTDCIFGKNENLVYSIFIPFSSNDYIKLYHNDESEINNTIILTYKPSNSQRNEFPISEVTCKRKYFWVESTDDDDDHETTGGKIWGIPAWLQDEITYPKHTCRFDLYGVDVESCFQTNKLMFSDGVAYIFLSDIPDEYKHGCAIGKLFLQMG